MKTMHNTFCIAGIDVDDVLFFGNNATLTNKLKHYVRKHLQVNRFDKDKLSYFGLEINNDLRSGTTTISQHHYIKELLKKCNIDYKYCRVTHNQYLPHQQ